jgi:hypothetical protein
MTTATLPPASPPVHGLLWRLGKFSLQVLATEAAAIVTWAAVDLWRHRKDFA